MNKATREAVEQIFTPTVQLGHLRERMSAQLDAPEARLAQMLIDHEARMDKKLQAIQDTAVRPARPPIETLTSLVTDSGETS